MSFSKLYSKYDVPAPRYTSYPTVPYWERTPTVDEWRTHLRDSLAGPESSWSMYFHIPFCETLCTFCGCNTSITKDHKRETPYVEHLLQEWSTYLREVPELGQRPLRQIHLGGGSPTFLSAASLAALLTPLLKQVKLQNQVFEGAVEVDPRRTTKEQLKVLRELGFNRVSMGVQDFNGEVQRLVNRIQPYAITAALTEDARKLGYESVNFDLIYGLAKQTRESIRETAKLTVQLRPDRIALYSFALVPWIKPAQRLFKDEDLPAAENKRELYEIAREILLEAGYVEVGMDHFALATDGLAKAMTSNSLHRNFMGYTDIRTDVLLGLGVSAISESRQSFHQNEKVLANYESLVEKKQFATLRGHVLTSADQNNRQQILEFMTEAKVKWSSPDQHREAKVFLAEMEQDGLVEITEKELRLTLKGRPFLRNACLFFDARLRAQKPDTPIFSRSI